MLPDLQDVALIRKQTQLCLGLFSAGTEALQGYRLQNFDAEPVSIDPLNGDSLRTLEIALFDEHARLSLWSSNIGVFAEVQFSLDFRIRDEPDLQQAFIGHLETIEYQMNIFNDVLKSISKENVNISNNISQYPQDLRQMLETVHSHCDWLHKLSNLIRKVSLNRQNERSDNFLWSDSEGNKSQKITENIIDGLTKYFTYLVKREISVAEEKSHHQPEDAMEQQKRLIERLARSMVIRHKRVLYRRSRQISYSISPTENPSQPVLRQIARPPTTAVNLGSSRSNPVVPKSRTLQETATTIDKQDLRRRMASPSTVSRGTADPVGTHDDLLYPPPPAEAKEGKEFICPYCGLIIQGTRNTPVRAWREHVSKDLTPFVCIFDDCEQESPVLYASKKQWLLHMSSRHRQEWRCTSKEHEGLQFDRPYLYADHLKLRHSEDILEDQIPLLVEVQASSIVPTLEHCPFCSETKEDLAAHIGGHLKRLALQSLPNSDDAQVDIEGQDHKSSTGGPDVRSSMESLSQFKWSEYEQDNFPNSLQSSNPSNEIGEWDSSWLGIGDWVEQVEKAFVANPTASTTPDANPVISRSPTGSSNNSWSTDSQPETIDDLLREAMVKAAGPGKSQFLPIGALNSIITRKRVLRDLKRQDIPKGHTITSKNLHIIADHILGTGSNAGTFKRIFAILCLMELSLEVGTFIADGISDRHLPFESTADREILVSSRNRLSPLCYRDTERSCWVPIAVFDNWKPHNIESFTSYQGWFLAPCFEFSSETKPKFSELHLHDCVVLPFLEEERKNSALGNQLELRSGSSVVRKVKIHPDHYIIPGCQVHDDRYFAVKQLRKLESAKTTSQQRQNQETQAYKRLDHILPKHMVRPLATYTYHDQLHLIFPWAEGNLHDFWLKHFPDIAHLKRTSHLAQWLSQQFLGLATALQGIHNPDADVSSLDSLAPRVRQQRHGRHGDIKPENILWFKGDDATEDFYGTLKICDLGSADFNGPDSESVHVSTIYEFTGTYRAPEFDALRRVSPQYDIWSFGCVLLQFMEWYLNGWEGVEQFTERRCKEESNRMFFLDNFFNNIFKGDMWVVQTKQSVRDEFELLREHPHCTDFVLDVLLLIKSSMLRVTPSKRAGCDEIVRQLEAIAQRCDQDAGYCTQRSIRPISRTSSDLSEIVHVTYPDSKKAELASVDDCNPQAPDPEAFVLHDDGPSLTGRAEMQAQDASVETSTARTTASVEQRTAEQTLRDRFTAIDTEHQSEPNTSGVVSKRSRRERLKDWVNRVI